MKKYKLIKKYPGSPELGTVVCNKRDTKWYHSIDNEDIFRGYNEIENHPEFWEEVVEDTLVYHIGNSLTEPHPGGKSPYYIYQDKESYCKINNIKYFYCKKDCIKWVDGQLVEKDYEILSVKYDCVICDKFDGTYWYDSSYKIITDYTNRIHIDSLNSHDVSIYSVKRKSDGEIFTVGDRAITKFSDYGSIVEFENKFNYIYITTHNGKNRCKLKDLKPIKKPLFTTEDGVDIYEGDKYYPILFNSFEYKGEFIAQSLNKGNNWTNPFTCKTFSTKEAAEEYILFKSKLLSLNDLIECWEIPKEEVVQSRLFKKFKQKAMKNVQD